MRNASRGRTLRWRRLALLPLAGGLAYLAWQGWLFSRQDEATMLAWGRFLAPREEAGRADLIYILGGDYIRRVPYAAGLFAGGAAPRIVIPREKMGGGDRSLPGAQEHFSDASERILRQAGVPAGAILQWTYQGGVTSTAEELRALEVYVETFPEVSSVIIVTSDYHTRRAGYTARRMLPGRVAVTVLGADNDGWTVENWWRHPMGRRTVHDEIVKLAYYSLRYVFG
jgi:uncharacterized SAM-binding protein YcdF (DUF218 family)